MANDSAEVLSAQFSACEIHRSSTSSIDLCEQLIIVSVVDRPSLGCWSTSVSNRPKLHDLDIPYLLTSARNVASSSC